MSLYLIFGIPAGLWLASLAACGLAFRWSHRSIDRRFLPAVILSVLAIAIGCLGLKRFHIYSTSTFNGHEYRSFDSNWLFISSLILGALTLAYALWKRKRAG